MFRRIEKGPIQWLLEAKVGPYKLYDISFESLIGKNSWVSDEVSLHQLLSLNLYFFPYCFKDHLCLLARAC